jgi:hypothetical protein
MTRSLQINTLPMKFKYSLLNLYQFLSEDVLHRRASEDVWTASMCMGFVLVPPTFGALIRYSKVCVYDNKLNSFEYYHF